MKRQRAIVLATTSLGLLWGWPLLAQRSASTEQIIEEIRVEAPRLVKREALLRGQATQVSLAYTVSYADLDLRQDAGARDLQTRIETAANEVCTQLERLYPQGSPAKDVCARRATDKAMVDAHAAIDEARRSR